MVSILIMATSFLGLLWQVWKLVKEYKAPREPPRPLDFPERMVRSPHLPKGLKVKKKSEEG